MLHFSLNFKPLMQMKFIQFQSKQFFHINFRILKEKLITFTNCFFPLQLLRKKKLLHKLRKITKSFKQAFINQICLVKISYATR